MILSAVPRTRKPAPTKAEQISDQQLLNAQHEAWAFVQGLLFLPLIGLIGIVVVRARLHKLLNLRQVPAILAKGIGGGEFPL
jgi:hypothetical protein